MKKVLLEYIIRNKKNFIIIITVFFIGIIGGIIFINNSNETQKIEISSYIGELVNNIKNSQNIDRLKLLIISIKQNILFILLIWFLGCTIIGGMFIYIAILYKGFAIGYTITSLIAVLGIKQGTIIVLISLVLQNIIFLPAMFLIAENRNKIMYRNLQKANEFKRRSGKAFCYYVDFNYVIYSI